LKAERAWFLTEEVRRAKPETEPLLTRWGKSGVFSESTDLSFLKQSSGPTPSDSLEEKHRYGETMFGGSKGVCPLGRRTSYRVREGEAASARKQASVGRGKAELFPLQGVRVRLNLPMSLHPSLNTLLSY